MGLGGGGRGQVEAPALALHGHVLRVPGGPCLGHLMLPPGGARVQDVSVSHR